MFLWPFVLFNSEASFSKQDFESMDSTLMFLAEGCITQKKRTRFGDFQNPSGIFRDFHGFLGIFEGFQIKKIPEKNQQLHKTLLLL